MLPIQKQYFKERLTRVGGVRTKGGSIVFHCNGCGKKYEYHYQGKLDDFLESLNLVICDYPKPKLHYVREPEKL